MNRLITAFMWLFHPWRLHAAFDAFLMGFVVRLKTQDNHIAELKLRIQAQDAVISDHVRLVRELIPELQAQKSPD